MSTLAERIMVSYQNEAHLVHEFFFPDIFPCMNIFFGHFPLHEFFFGFFPTPPITFLMVRPLYPLVTPVVRTDGRTDVRTDGHVIITSLPEFLGLIGYQISLAMELR